MNKGLMIVCYLVVASISATIIGLKVEMGVQCLFGPEPFTAAGNFGFAAILFTSLVAFGFALVAAAAKREP